MYSRVQKLPRVRGGSYTGRYIPGGLKRSRLDYTRIYYGLGQFIPRGLFRPRPIHTSQAKSYPHSLMISIAISIVLSDMPKNYLIFQQVAEDSVLSVNLSEKPKLTELKS